MAEYTLTLYEADDETPMVEFGTAAAHARPWLHLPEVYGEAEISLLEGKSRIGRMSLRLIDPQTGATRANRGLTALLGDADGYSLFNGRRAVFAMADPAVVILDGLCAGVRLETLAGYRIDLDDVRARGIEVPLFNRTGTTTVLPRGVLDGYGAVPGGDWLVPPTVPLEGTYNALEASQGIVVFPLDGQYEGRILTDDMLRAARVAFDQEQGRTIYPDVEVWWRPVGDASWRVHARMETPLYTFGSSPSSVLKLLNQLFGTIPGQYQAPGGPKYEVDYISRVFLRQTPDQPTLPIHGQDVEVLVVYVGPATERFPMHFEGSAGELLRNVLRGDYSTDEAGEAIDPRIRYDEAQLVGAAALPALQVPVRLRIMKPSDDLREWVEDACRALGVAPALNAAGEISPVSLELPDETVVLPEINDGNAEPIPGWEHPTSGAVTRVEITYARDYRVPSSQDPFAERSAADGIASVEQLATVDPLDPTVQQTIGVKPHVIDGFLWRAIGGEDGQPLLGEFTDEAGYQHAQRRGMDTILRFALGGQSRFVRVSRSDVDLAAVRVGDWVLDACSWPPNYAAGARGRNHIAQVVSIRDLSPIAREMRLVDSAPYANPVAQSTLGVITADDEGIVSVPVATVPAGGEARVDYAISDTLPPTSSGLWTLLDRTDAVATLQSPPFPAGATVWIRTRGEQVGRRPSAWTNAVSIATPSTPRVLRAYLTLEDDQPIVLGEVNAHALGVRVYYGLHRPADDPGTLTLFQDFDAADGTWELDGVSLRTGEAITVEIEPWTGWDGADVTGTAGTRHALAGRRAVDADSFRILAVDLVAQTGALRTYRVRTGAGVEEADIHWATFENPLPDDYLATLYGVENLREVISDGETFDAPQPAEGEILAFVVIPRATASSGEIPVIGDGWEGIVEGGTAAIDAFATFTRLTSTTERIDITVTDPRGVVSGVNVYETFKGVTTGPLAATLSGGVWQHTYTLDPDHPLYLRVLLVRSDGNEPLVLHFTADFDEVPGIPTVREVRIVDQASLYVDALDTDTVSLWYQEVVGGVPAPEVEILPRSADPRFGAFTVTAGAAEREFRVYGRNEDGDAGEYRHVIVERYIEYAEAADVATELGDLQTYIDGAFADSMISAAESAAIAEHVRQLNVEKADLDERYAALIANPLLTGTAASNLTTAKTAYDTAHADLLSTIAAAIADGAITPTERADVDAGFGAYETALGTLSQRFTEALDAVQPAVMREEISEDGTTGTLTLTPLAGAAFDTVEFATRSGNGAWSAFAVDAVAPYSASVTLDPKHPSAIAYRVSKDSEVVQQRVVPGFDIGTVSQVLDIQVTPDGSGTAALRAIFDTDTALGVGGAQYRVDGGTPVALTVAADLTAEWTVAQSASAEQLVEVQGHNAAGAWGDWFPITVPIYQALPSSFARIVTLTAVRQSPGNCGLGTHLTNRVTAEFQDTQVGDTWDLLRFEDGVEAATVVVDNPVSDLEVDDVLTGFEETSLGAPVAVVYRAYLTPAAGGLDAKDSPPLTQEWQACP